MSQTKPLPKRHTPSGELKWRVFSAGFPRGDTRSARIIHRFDPPFRMAKIGERAGWSAVWYSSLTGWEKSAQFKLKMVSDVLLLSYLNKIGLSLTGEAGQASAYLNSEARLYKGASLALVSVGYHTFYRQHLRGGKESRPQQHTWNSEFFVLSCSKYLLHLVYIFNILWRLKVKVSRHLQ